MPTTLTGEVDLANIAITGGTIGGLTSLSTGNGDIIATRTDATGTFLRAANSAGSVQLEMNNGYALMGSTSGQNVATILMYAGGGIATVESAGFTISSGKALKLGNAYAAGAIVVTGSLELTDSAGVVYQVPAMAKP